MLRLNNLNWRSLAMILAVTVAAIAFSALVNINRVEAKMEKLEGLDAPFAEIDLPELDAILKSKRAGQLLGRDRLIVANGTFLCTELERIVSTLRKAGFTSTMEVDFVGGSGENWERPSGVIIRELGFERASRQYDQLKLFELKGADCVFQFQSTGF